jgi:hypothetical protein
MKWSRMWVIAPLVGALAVACGEDIVVEDLIGTWNATEFVFSNFEDPVTDVDVIDLGGEVTIIIRADNTYTVQLELPGAEPEEVDGEWVLNGDVLTFDEGTADETVFNISLSGTTLTIHTEDLEFDFDEDGTDEPAQLDATFVKQ